MRSLSPEHMQVIVDAMGSTETENRLRLIGDNIDVFVATLTPFLKLLIKEAPDDTLRCQSHLNGCILCAETARVLVEKERMVEAIRMAKEDLEWARTIFPILCRMSNESQANFVCNLMITHANEYRRLGLEDEAWQAYRLVDPIFYAIEFVRRYENQEKLPKVKSAKLFYVEAVLRHAGFISLANYMKKLLAKLRISSSKVNRLKKEACERVAEQWHDIPGPNRTGGTSRKTAFSFTSREVGFVCAQNSPCPRCHARLEFTKRMIELGGFNQFYMVFHFRCSKCLKSVAYHIDISRYSGVEEVIQFIGSETSIYDLKPDQFILLLRKLAPYEFSEDDALESLCKNSIQSVISMLDKVFDHNLPLPYVATGVIPGMFGEEMSPFCQTCKEGFAVIVPNLFIVRLFRFARFFSLSWGITDDTSITEPILSFEKAQEVSELLASEFWKPQMDSLSDSLSMDMPQDMIGMVSSFVENCLTFVIAHEFAHIFLGHIGEMKAISYSNEELHIPVLTYKQTEEISADITAAVFVKKLLEEKQKEHLIELFNTASIDMYFTLLTLIEGKYRPDERIHPAAHIRRAALRSRVGEYMTSKTFLFSLQVQLALENSSPNPPYKPDLPNLLRGNWERLESGLMKFSMGNHQESFDDLVSFLIHDPTNSEGWQALGHLKIHGQKNVAFLVPMNTIGMFPSAEGKTLIVKVNRRLLSDDPNTETMRELWMKYAKDIIGAAGEVGSMNMVSLEQEVTAIESLLKRSVSEYSFNLQKSSLRYIIFIQEKGLLREFTYFARGDSLQRPGFTEFQRQLLDNKSRVHDLVNCLVVNPM